MFSRILSKPLIRNESTFSIRAKRASIEAYSDWILLSVDSIAWDIGCAQEHAESKV